MIVDSNTAFVPSVFSRKHPLLLLIHCANASLLALLSFESASVDSLGITSPTLTTPHLTHQLYPTPQCERGCLKPGHWRGIWQHHHLLRKIILIAMIPTLIALHHEHSLNLTWVLAILPFGNSAHDLLLGNFTIQLTKQTLFKTSKQ